MTDPIGSLCDAVELRTARELSVSSAVRAALLEAAAKMCEDRERDFRSNQTRNVCRLCAADIRRLIALPADVDALPGLDDLEDVSLHDEQEGRGEGERDLLQYVKYIDGRLIAVEREFLELQAARQGGQK